MSRRLRELVCLLCFLLPLSAGAVERWSKLTIGMTAEQAVAALGEPLFRNIGRGFELWIYDHDAEVLFFGNVIGWSAPPTDGAPRRMVDVWQASPGKDDFLAVLARLPPRATQPASLTKRATVPIDRRPALRFFLR